MHYNVFLFLYFILLQRLVLGLNAKISGLGLKGDRPLALALKVVAKVGLKDCSLDLGFERRVLVNLTVVLYA